MPTFAAMFDGVRVVPYLPTLGPLHPDEAARAVWSQVLSVNGTGRFLAYDKSSVWGGVKTQEVLVDSVTESVTGCLVPVLNRRGGGRVDVFVYGGPAERGSVEQVARSCAGREDAPSRLVWFGQAPDPRAANTVRIHLRTFTSGDVPALPTHEIGSLDGGSAGAADLLAAFGAEVREGFGFLARRLAEGIDDGPVLTVSEGRRILGAIGPMRIIDDSDGRRRLLGQYFAVLPERRGEGIGRSLWRAGMQWGHGKGANYQLPQTELCSPSDRLCTSEGLTDLGLVHSTRSCSGSSGGRW